MDDRPGISHTAGHAGDVLVYADYACPFCYLGQVSLDRYRNSPRVLAVEWHPLDRHGRQPETGVAKADDPNRHRVERLAEESGVEMAQYTADGVDSRPAQRVAWHVRMRHPEHFEAFHRALFDALWRACRDIGDRVVLDELAVGAGLPEGFVTSTLEDPASASSLRLAFQDARQRGVDDVPTFVAGGNTLRGPVSPTRLRGFLERPY